MRRSDEVKEEEEKNNVSVKGEQRSFLTGSSLSLTTEELTFKDLLMMYVLFGIVDRLLSNLM